MHAFASRRAPLTTVKNYASRVPFGRKGARVWPSPAWYRQRSAKGRGVTPSRHDEAWASLISVRRQPPQGGEGSLGDQLIEACGVLWDASCKNWRGDTAGCRNYTAARSASRRRVWPYEAGAGGAVPQLRDAALCWHHACPFRGRAGMRLDAHGPQACGSPARGLARDSRRW
jgi:hypothetical protein